jgi:hypothetical protein
MTLDRTAKLLLFATIVLLSLIALRPLVEPAPVRAAGDADWNFEPGTTMLRAPGNTRQVVGKVAINLNTGEVWGFPTLTSAPYPVDSTSDQPPVSRPIYLGRFDLAAARR